MEIGVLVNTDKDLLNIYVKDNGKGMTQQQADAAQNPFFTTRTTRKVGLGIPLFKMAAEMTGGKLALTSQPNVGTLISADFGWTHIDRMPLGDLCGTLTVLIRMNPDVDFVYIERFNDREMTLDTRELREVLEGVSLSNPDVIAWIEEFYKENSPLI